MAQTGGIKAYLDDFKKSKLAIPFSLVLAGLIAYILLIVGSVLFCLLPAAIALVIFGLPRYFGLVNRKKLLIYGTILILLLGVASGLTYYSILSTETSVTLSTPDNVLTGGSITPFRGTDSTIFHFSVIYTGTNPAPHVNLTVYDYYQASQGTTYNLTNDISYTGTGDRYVLNLTFPTSIYDFGYSYDKLDGSTVTTDLSWGPYTMTNDDILINQLWKVPFTMFLNVGLLFYLLILLTWWMERSKKRFEAQGGRSVGKAAPKTTEKFVCSECGSEVPASADKCPQCGEKFEEDERSTAAAIASSAEPKSSEFICSDCGKTVKETDTQCWNCGKKFED
jgi:DNA-directed RNA polymerase subunit RPC12/RpoP